MNRASAGRKLESLAPYVLSAVRVLAAFAFLQAGTMKLFGFPSALPGPISLFSEIGVAGMLETGGGLLMLAGLYTRPVAFILSGEMAVAYFQVHYPQNFWLVLNGGMGAYLFCFLWLYFVFAGAGPWSLDARRARRRNPPTGP